MIRIEPAAAGETLLWYRDVDDPLLYYHVPTRATLSTLEDGRPRFAQLTLQGGGPDKVGISMYQLFVRVDVPEAEVARFARDMTDAERQPVTVVPAPVWSVDAAVLSDHVPDPVACWCGVPGDYWGDILVSVFVRSEDEPAFTRVCMSERGIDVGLTLKLTGDATPFRAVMRTNHAIIEQYLRSLFTSTHPISWDEVRTAVGHLVSTGAIQVETGDDRVDRSVLIAEATRYIINWLMVPRCFPACDTGPSDLRSAWFRMRPDHPKYDRNFDEITGFDLRTSCIGIMIPVRSVPASNFFGLKETSCSLGELVRRRMASRGVVVAGSPGVP